MKINDNRESGRDGIRTRDLEVRNLSPYPLGHTPRQGIRWEKKNGYEWPCTLLTIDVVWLSFIGSESTPSR